MKLKQINEVGHAAQPALVSIDWGEFTEVYGPFKSWEAGQKFVEDMQRKAEDAGFGDLRDVGIFDIDVQQPQDPQEAVDSVDRRIQGYVDDQDN